MALYLDASAAAKLLVDEVESDAGASPEDTLIEEAARSSMAELAAWTVEADEVLTF